MKTQIINHLVRNIVSYLTIFVVSLFVSCSDEEFEDGIESSSDLGKYYTFLVNSGFERSTITYHKESDMFIIDKDLLISRDEVTNYIKRDGLDAGINDKQRRGTYIVSADNARDVTYFVEGNVPQSWQTAINGAVAQYNAINGSGLRVSLTNDRNNADARIFIGFSNENWVARALLPNSSRRVGSWIEINTRFNNMESGRKLFTMVHEMGHNFGLLHTNQNSGSVIQGTPLTDSNSVMNSSVLPWNGFTNFDLVAIRTLYPGDGGGGSENIVTVYRHCPFSGSSQTYGVGDYNLNDLLARGTRNDDISSFKVAQGYKIIIYADKDFSGRAASATFSVDCLQQYNWNDIISSFRVVKN
ncbi:M12 family metallo-peptidase [uncultured Aquimarina sp.]|uniref:M12 family metallo-peptidase n=1 Tax=uncultured Aquimarina sp. TaxID=575652 RepID=UPI002627950C|nr:M12 family metallo-peptidase [uncultured Aquimarina sp.]